MKIRLKMLLFSKPEKLTKPNELGYQFGISEDLTDYAHKSQPMFGGSDLPSVNITVYEIWKDDRLEGWILIDEDTGEPLKEYAGYEACGVGIDQYKIAKKLK